MRIALVILHADPARGGAERYTIDLAEALARREHEVSILASSFAKTPADVRQVTLAATGLTRLARYKSFLRSLDAHLKSAQYDVVHAMLPVRRCDVYHPHAGVAADAISTGHLKYESAVGRGVSRAFNALNRKRRHFARVERRVLTSAEPPLVICLSDCIRRSVLAHYSFPPEKLVTIVNGVDLARFDPKSRPRAGQELRRRFNLDDNEVVALIIAQDFHRKGLASAIDAMAIVNEPRLRLLVVGKEATAKYERLAERLGVASRVTFAGPTSDTYSFYAAADFFVLPTRHDPCSLVVLEALAMGVPVISTAQNGACEVMADGREGFVLPDPGDAQRLAEAMRTMLDAAARKRMREACLALRPGISSEHHVEQVLRVYEQTCRVGLAPRS